MTQKAKLGSNDTSVVSPNASITLQSYVIPEE